MLAKAAWQSTQLDCVHIHSCGNGCLGFRFYSGSLWKSAGMPAQPKVTKGLLPHHSAPRLGSVCPNTGLNPWAAATRHPWRGAANPASCRVTHELKPAFGQRGLTGRLRSKAEQDQERLASHRSYRWLLQPTKLCRYQWLSQASQLPHVYLHYPCSSCASRSSSAAIRASSSSMRSTETAPALRSTGFPRAVIIASISAGSPSAWVYRSSRCPA